MAAIDDAWTETGTGTPPRVAWSFRAEGRLTHLVHAREADETFVADAAGGLSWLDPLGRLRQLTRGLPGVNAAAVADDGSCAAVGYDGQKLALLDRSLSVLWMATLHDDVTAVALDPFGRHVAVGLGNRDGLIYATGRDGAARRRVADFEAIRPVRFLAFAATRPLLVAAADHGMLAAYSPAGKLLWDTRLWAGCGDVAISGDAGRIFLAAHAHGVQRYDGRGANRGTFLVDGTPGRLALSFDGTRLGVATLERHLYRLGGEGDLLWAATAPDDVAALAIDGPGRDLFVGFSEGRAVRLRWGR